MKTEGQFILMNINEFTNWVKEEKVTRSVKRIQNHHTWKPNYGGFKDDSHFRLLNGMRRSHLKRGFSDIAQNITSFPDGTIAVCRPLNRVPVGIKGANRGGICIEHVGNFDKASDSMNKKHKETIIHLNAILCDRFNLFPNTDTLVYHHWWDLITGRRKDGRGSTKSCPGTNFFGGNTLKDARTNFIPKVIDKMRLIGVEINTELVDVPIFLVRYSGNKKILYGKELQLFLNQFPNVKLKEDGWPGKKTSDAFKQVTGYYLKGDPKH